MTADHIKETIYKRIETLFNCKSGKGLFNSMVDLQLELQPEISKDLAESFVVYGIIKEFEDYQLDKLWFLHLIEKSHQPDLQAA